MILLVDDNSGILFIKTTVVEAFKYSIVVVSKLIKSIAIKSKIWTP